MPTEVDEAVVEFGSSGIGVIGESACIAVFHGSSNGCPVRAHPSPSRGVPGR